MSQSKKKISGKVFIKKYGKGTKSEHDAIFIQDNKTHDEYNLRLKGSNPFENKELREYVGKDVTVKGSFLDDSLFLADKIERITP